MRTRVLGEYGLSVSALGLGCMGMSEFYGTPDESHAIETIRRALDLGVTLIDTADMYGRGANEELVGKALASDRDRDRARVATKVGIVRREDGSDAGSCGRPEYIRDACEASLRRLGLSTQSTCISCTVSTQRSRSRRRSERWQSSWRPARCGFWVSPRRCPQTFDGQTAS